MNPAKMLQLFSNHRHNDITNHKGCRVGKSHIRQVVGPIVYWLVMVRHAKSIGVLGVPKRSSGELDAGVERVDNPAAAGLTSSSSCWAAAHPGMRHPQVNTSAKWSCSSGFLTKLELVPSSKRRNLVRSSSSCICSYLSLALIVVMGGSNTFMYPNTMNIEYTPAPAFKHEYSMDSNLWILGVYSDMLSILILPASSSTLHSTVPSSRI